MPDWRRRVEELEQVPAVRDRLGGRRWTDQEVFRGLLLAVLSGGTDWSRIQALLPPLTELFHGFDVQWYSVVTPAAVRDDLVPWFRAQGAGSQFLEKNLNDLRRAARQLRDRASPSGSLDSYVSDLLAVVEGDVIRLAVRLGRVGPDKLPGLGVPLAAEFLKNLGYDLAKPDRHVNRAAAAFGWVEFRKWDKAGRIPQANLAEQVQVMRSTSEFAGHLGLPVCFVDNALWLLGASSGLRLTNSELAALAGRPWDRPGG
jgi:hypothetical protein